MKCPACPDVNLLMTERQNVEIDYCPNCRGVWLDRGELDKLIERSASGASAVPTAQPHYASMGYPRKEANHSQQHSAYGHEHHRKKSWLSEIFD
jgi:hypothetical protein